MQDKKIIIEKLRETSNHMDLALEAGERGDWPRMREALLEIHACAGRLATVVEPAAIITQSILKSRRCQLRSNQRSWPLRGSIFVTPDALATRVRGFMEAAGKAVAATQRGDLPTAQQLFQELQRSNAVLLRLIEIKLSEDAHGGRRIGRGAARRGSKDR